MRQYNERRQPASGKLFQPKQIQKELRRGNEVYLALVLPKSVPAQGMTQQRKRDQMKLKGPVRKAPPIAETRKKLCSECAEKCTKRTTSAIGGVLGSLSKTTPEGQASKTGGGV